MKLLIIVISRGWRMGANIIVNKEVNKTFDLFHVFSL